jgi:hypothetical protein
MLMADPHDHSPKPTRAAPPPFMGPPRAGALAPKTRSDRPTLPPFSPPFVKRPSPVVRQVSEQEERAARTVAPPAAVTREGGPSWLDAPPNESVPTTSTDAAVGIAWVNPDEPAVTPPPQAATGTEWLDSPVPENTASAPSSTPAPDVDDVFGWDPAEERAGTLDTAPVSESLNALKELEPWALPGAEPSASSSEEVASTLERLAARVRSGDLFVPGALAAASEEAVLAAVLTALLQRARG